MTINRKFACISRISRSMVDVRLKVTVKKWRAMRQGIDLNRKKECRGEVVTVMFHGSFWLFSESKSVSSRSARPMELSFRMVVSAGHSSKVAMMQQLRSRAGSLASVLSSQSSLTVGKLSKIFSQARVARSAAFHIEGLSSSSCANTALNLITKKSEQRCCAAA